MCLLFFQWNARRGNFMVMSRKHPDLWEQGCSCGCEGLPLSMYSHAHEAAEAWDDYAVEHNLGLASYNKGPRREAYYKKHSANLRARSGASSSPPAYDDDDTDDVPELDRIQTWKSFTDTEMKRFIQRNYGSVTAHGLQRTDPTLTFISGSTAIACTTVLVLNASENDGIDEFERQGPSAPSWERQQAKRGFFYLHIKRPKCVTT